jgi:hypothetical protein
MKFLSFWKPERFRLVLGVYDQESQRFYGNCFTEGSERWADLTQPSSGDFCWTDHASTREAVAKLLGYPTFDEMVATSKSKVWEGVSVRIVQLIHA